MPYEVTWLVDKRIIYFHTSGIATIDDVKAGNKKVMVMLDEGIPFVHLITDSTDVEKVQLGLNDLASVFRDMPASPKLGWSIYISPKMLDRFFASVTTQLTKSRHREFNTLADAIAFLQSVDDTLPKIELPSHHPQDDTSKR
jgi:hypothetical protein